MRARIRFCCERAVIFSFQRAALEVDAELITFCCGLVEIGVGDDRQAAGNQVVVHIPLALQFLFLPELFGQAAFHLAETQVMQFGGIHMGAGNHGVIGQFRQFRRALHRGIGMIGGIQRNQDTSMQGGAGRWVEFFGNSQRNLGNHVMNLFSLSFKNIEIHICEPCGKFRRRWF